MRFLFRADASLDIGTGHVVRCATLARELANAGQDVQFLCRDQPGDLIDWLEAQELRVIRLVPAGCDQPADAALCRGAVGHSRYDWLVVDHYELDAVWEMAMTTVAQRILAIDDLGRSHACDVLLDQNCTNPAQELYAGRVPARCQLLFGPGFALVRPEFAALRPASLERSRRAVSRLIIFMGGSDLVNETTKAVNGIALAASSNAAVDVVIGKGNPHRRAVERACGKLSNVELHVQTARMAELMAKSDCAIGAAGSTTWERCVLGLPALVTITAENQVQIAERVAAIGGHRLLGWHHDLSPESYAQGLAELTPALLSDMSQAAAGICDGEGAKEVAARLLTEPTHARTYAAGGNA
jgi:UDP-2,4-diacetamido-2,4,6-trideoxy-beta-L-altropyranose hydrolase